MICPCQEKTIVRSRTYFVDIGGAHVFLQGSMTSSDTGPTSRCTLLMSFLHARRHRRPPTPFIGPIPIGFLRIPSPSSLRLARRNVRNSSDYSMVRRSFYIVLPFLIVSLQILASNLVFHTRAWSRESYYESVCSVFASTARKSYLVHYTQHIGARSTSGRTDPYPVTSVICTLLSTHRSCARCWKSSSAYYA